MGLKRLLGAVGMESESVATPEEEKSTEREQQMVMAYRWLRTHAVDRAISEYFELGNFTRLEDYCEGAVLKRLKNYLTSMRERGVAWIPTSPEERARAEITVVSYDQSPDGAVTRFIVQESFLDAGGVAAIDQSGMVLDAHHPNPERRVLQAVVSCVGPQSYRISELRQVTAGG